MRRNAVAAGRPLAGALTAECGRTRGVARLRASAEAGEFSGLLVNNTVS